MDEPVVIETQHLALCQCGLWFRGTTKERAQAHLAKHVNGQEDPAAHGLYDPTANPPQAGGAQPC